MLNSSTSSLYSWWMACSFYFVNDLEGPTMIKITRWISNEFATFTVDTEDGIIVNAAPIARRFKGQPFVNLLWWMQKKGGVTVVKTLEKKNE